MSDRARSTRENPLIARTSVNGPSQNRVVIDSPTVTPLSYDTAHPQILLGLRRVRGGGERDLKTFRDSNLF